MVLEIGLFVFLSAVRTRFMSHLIYFKKIMTIPEKYITH